MSSRPDDGAALLRKGGLGRATRAMARTMELARRAASGTGGPWAASRALSPRPREQRLPPAPMVPGGALTPEVIAAAGAVARPPAAPALPFAKAATGAPLKGRAMSATALALSPFLAASFVPDSDRRDGDAAGSPPRGGRVPGAAAAMTMATVGGRAAPTDFRGARSRSSTGPMEAATVNAALNPIFGDWSSGPPWSSAATLPGAAISGAYAAYSSWRVATRERLDAEPSAANLAAGPPLAWAPPAVGGWSADVAPMLSSTAAPRSFAPPVQAAGGGPVSGDVHLDGVRMGRWVVERMARELGRPQTGSTAFDPTRTPRWPGTLQGS